MIKQVKEKKEGQKILKRRKERKRNEEKNVGAHVLSISVSNKNEFFPFFSNYEDSTCSIVFVFGLLLRQVINIFHFTI